MEKLTETENFRLTKPEKKLLGTLAADIGVSKSDYLRHVINNREKPKIVVKGESEEEKLKKSLKENYQSLGKIGVNLNQISHYFNLEHLKSFDVLDPKIENILLLDRLQKNELVFLRENLENLSDILNDFRTKIEGCLSGDNFNKI